MKVFICVTLLVLTSTLTWSQSLMISPNTPTTKCPTDTLTLRTTLTGATAPVSYRWYRIGYPEEILGNSDSLTLLNSGFTSFNQFRVVVEDANTWRDSIATTVVIKNSIDYQLNFNDTLTCTGDTIRLEGQTTANGVRYQWLTSVINPITQEDTSSIYLANRPGLYTVIARPPSASILCPVVDTVLVRHVALDVQLVANDLNPCLGDSVLVSNSRTAPMNSIYTWNTSATDESIFVRNSGNYSLTVTSPFPQSCTATDDINLFFTPAPLIDLGGERDSLCNGSVLTLDNLAAEPTTGLIHSWRFNGTIVLSSDTLYQADTAGTYSLSIRTGNGACLVSDSIVLSIQNPMVELPPDTSFCESTSLVLSNLMPTSIPAGSSFDWNNGSGSSASLLVDTSGTYWLTVTTSGLGCIASDSITVTFFGDVRMDFDTPEVSLTDSLILNGAERVSPGPGSRYTFTWLDGSSDIISSDSIVAIDQDGIYSVNLGANGCIYDFSFEVNVTEPTTTKRLYIPSAFSTSSSDPTNHFLKVLGESISDENFSFKVYSQWGQLLFETTSFSDMNQQGWNGQVNGAYIVNGTYTYTLNGQFLDGEVIKESGKVTFFR